MEKLSRRRMLILAAVGAGEVGALAASAAAGAHFASASALTSTPKSPAAPGVNISQGPLAAYLFKHGLLKRGGKHRLMVEQGYQIGRPSKLTTTFEVNEGAITSIKVGGDVLLVAKGEFLVS